ncbi:MAG TPA: hypothetical protein VFI92_12755 [Steroidobacteraceae bacterium]|nr:hypothetical protein [Steroidobacteraceae bacterium]
MTRQISAFAAGVLGVSAVMLTACGRTPTEPSYAAQGVQEPDASVTAPVVAASTPEASLSAREEELAARERALREEREALRREREQLAVERARAGDTLTGSRTAFDADVAPAPRAPAGSIQKVPTPPIVVPSGTALQVELAANVDTRVARVGDRVEGRLAEDLMVDDGRAALAGAVVSGTVTGLVPVSGAIDRAPTLELTFDSLQAANGATVPIAARYVERGESVTALNAAAVQKTGGEAKLRAGTVITVPTEMSFSVY